MGRISALALNFFTPAVILPVKAHTILVDAYAKEGNLQRAEHWMRPIAQGVTCTRAVGMKSAEEVTGGVV